MAPSYSGKAIRLPQAFHGMFTAAVVHLSPFQVKERKFFFLFILNGADGHMEIESILQLVPSACFPVLCVYPRLQRRQHERKRSATGRICHQHARIK